MLGNLERVSEKVRTESLLGGSGAKRNRGFVQVAEISAGIQDRCCFYCLHERRKGGGKKKETTEGILSFV